MEGMEGVYQGILGPQFGTYTWFPHP
jgi:hypothetical protein